MIDSGSTQILYPVFAMVLLVAFVLVQLGSRRVAALRKRRVNLEFYRLYQGDDEPDDIRVVTRHFSNLFEMPVLFYVGVILTYVTHQVSLWMVVCAWAYVGLRYLHTYVHLGSNDVTRRFQVYIASGAVLVVFWASLLLRLLANG